MEAQLHRFLSLPPNGSEWPSSRLGGYIPGQYSPVHIYNRRLGGPQSRSGRFGEEKHLLPPVSGIAPRFLGSFQTIANVETNSALST